MTDQPAGLPSPRRGAIAAPRSALAAAAPYAALVGAPPNFITIPQRISMWGNDVHGDCVTAEEAFAKACNNPEIFITDDEVITWAKRHGVLEGAYLTDVMGWMQNDGFADGASIYDDGPYLSVNWMNSPVLQNAIFTGPVKIGVAADQIEAAWRTTGGRTGWFGTGFHIEPPSHEDHCVSLCGYGSLSWLAQQLGVSVPGGVNGNKAGYALFTWNSIGIIDVPSMTAVTFEAWLRQPTTVTKSVVANWGPSIQYDTGDPNAVALDNNGHAVEVHVGTGRLFHRVGNVNFAGQAIAWGASTEYDTGGPNAVALDNSGHAVEVHVGTNRLFYRVGNVNFAGQTIAWGPSAQYDTGSSCAVALDNNGRVVEVHVGTGRLFYRVGTVDFIGQTISWGPSTQYDTGGPNAVALDNNHRVVEVHVGTERLFVRVGQLTY